MRASVYLRNQQADLAAPIETKFPLFLLLSLANCGMGSKLIVCLGIFMNYLDMETGRAAFLMAVSYREGGENNNQIIASVR